MKWISLSELLNQLLVQYCMLGIYLFLTKPYGYMYMTPILHEFTKFFNSNKLLMEQYDFLIELQIYQEKLSGLRNQGEPIKMRHLQWEYRPLALEEFVIAIQRARKVVEQCK